MNDDKDIKKARQNRAIAALRMHVDELRAITAVQGVLLESLYRQRFSERPGEFEALMERFLADLTDARKLEPMSEERELDQRNRITFWLQKFRDKVAIALRKG